MADENTENDTAKDGSEQRNHSISTDTKTNSSNVYSDVDKKNSHQWEIGSRNNKDTIPEPPPSLIFTPDMLEKDERFSSLYNKKGEISDSSEAQEVVISKQWINEVETLVSSGQWHRIVEVFSSTEDISKLPHALQIIYCIARKEAAPDDKGTRNTYEITIKAVSNLLKIPENSPIAVVIAKRTLRSRRPWSKRKAPRGPLSMLLVILALSLGAFVGWGVTMFI